MYFDNDAIFFDTGTLCIRADLLYIGIDNYSLILKLYVY